MHELVPAFERIGLDVEVNIFCDANADQFLPHWFPRILFTRNSASAKGSGAWEMRRERM